MAEKERPGVMLYFDLRPCLKRLSNEEKGLLFEALMDYAQYGELPELDGMTGIAWDFIRPRIDRDAERYEEMVELKRRAARKRWDKQEDAPQAEEDQPGSMQVHAGAFSAMQAMPTTTTTSTTKTTSSSSSSSTSAPTPTPMPVPTAPRQNAADRRAVEKEMNFEELRQQKLKILAGIMGSG